jgi:hypothetical protein
VCLLEGGGTSRETEVVWMRREQEVEEGCENVKSVVNEPSDSWP